MAHPIYSRQQLLNCGLVKVKKVAADLGVVPTGDKRLVQSWVDAIVEHQASKIQKIEIVEATIVFDDGLATCELAKYHVIVSGEIVHSVIAYAAAEGWVTRKGYTLVDSQTLAQNELEVEMEQQAVARADKFAQIESIYPNCDDPMGRTAYKKDYSSSEWYDVLVNNGFELEAKKHLQDVEMQSAATVEAESIKFISIDFGYHEAVAYGEVVATISTVFDRDTDNMAWVAEGNINERSFDSYEEAKIHVKSEYRQWRYQLKKRCAAVLS